MVSSVVTDKQSSAKGTFGAGQERNNGMTCSARSPRVLKKGSSFDSKYSYDKKEISPRAGEKHTDSKRSHSVDIVATRESEKTSKSTQTWYFKVNKRRPLIRSKSMVILKPMELKPILKCTADTGNLKQTSEEEGGSDAATADPKFCYRLPEKKPAKLRKTVSFKEDGHRIKIKDYSRTYGSPEVPLTDDIFDMNKLEGSLVDF